MKVRVDFKGCPSFLLFHSLHHFFMVYRDKVLYTDTFMPIITKI